MWPWRYYMLQFGYLEGKSCTHAGTHAKAHLFSATLLRSGLRGRGLAQSCIERGPYWWSRDHAVITRNVLTTPNTQTHTFPHTYTIHHTCVLPSSHLISISPPTPNTHIHSHILISTHRILANASWKKLKHSIWTLDWKSVDFEHNFNSRLEIDWNFNLFSTPR